MSAYATTGLQSLGELPWGSHVCQFFSDGSDLRDTLVPYFKAGLENNERCLLVAMEPFNAENAPSDIRFGKSGLAMKDRRERDEIGRSTRDGLFCGFNGETSRCDQWTPE